MIFLSRIYIIYNISIVFSIVSLQDEFLRCHFIGVERRQVQDQLLCAIEDEPPSDPDLLATDSELAESDEVFEESGSEAGLFLASDDEAKVGLGAASGSKRSYAKRRAENLQFLGKAVCVRACSKLLGVGQKILQRLREGQEGYVTKRAQIPKHPTFQFAMRGDSAERWPSVVMYLWLVYHSAAECMPTDPHHALRKPEGKNLEAPFPVSTDDADSDEVSRRINAFMTSLHTYNSDIDVHLIGPGTFKGERRDLQKLEGTSISLFVY